ncbi:MAG: mechanosensitive ion channel family protein [Gammaproteobacteria bacterium]
MSYVFLGNSMVDWTAALSVAAAVAVVAYAVVKFISHRLRVVAASTDTYVDDVFANSLDNTGWWFLLIGGLYIGSYWLDLKPKQELFVQRTAITIAAIQAAVWGDTAIRGWLKYCVEKARRENVASTTSTAVMGFVARTMLWTVCVLMILDNLGFNIATLVASLGIGGIAVALAVQNILGDLFASLSIVLDKPFVVGDFIIVGDALGTVEFIGLKTTRIRSLGGEQIVFSNADLLRSRIHNHKRMEERRQAFVIGVSYDTTAEQLRKIPLILREEIEAREKVRFDRAHFRNYTETAMEFEAVYFMTTPDYNLMMDYQQAINVALYERFEREGIKFASPRRQIYLVKDDEREARREDERGPRQFNTVRH